MTGFGISWHWGWPQQHLRFSHLKTPSDCSGRGIELRKSSRHTAATIAASFLLISIKMKLRNDRGYDSDKTKNNNFIALGRKTDRSRWTNGTHFHTSLAVPCKTKVKKKNNFMPLNINEVEWVAKLLSSVCRADKNRQATWRNLAMCLST